MKHVSSDLVRVILYTDADMPLIKKKKKICLDKEAEVVIHVFLNWLHCDGIAICPACEMLRYVWLLIVTWVTG